MKASRSLDNRPAMGNQYTGAEQNEARFIVRGLRIAPLTKAGMMHADARCPGE